MALDYITIGISLIIFIFYLATLFFLIEVKKRLTKDAGRTFVYLMIAVIFLIIRRLQQIFIKSSILSPGVYSSDIVTLVFAILFFLAIFYFKKAIDNVSKHSEREKVGSILSNYRKKLGR